MVLINPERETVIYELWKTGHTVDEIADQTGIPRSTVGYYVRKFNKDPRKRDLKLDINLNQSLIKPKSDENHTSPLSIMSGYYKICSIRIIMDTIKKLQETESYDQIYYLLQSLQLFPKVLEHFKPLPKEIDLINKREIVDLKREYKKEIDKGNVFAYMIQTILSTTFELQSEQHETAQQERPKLNARDYLGPPEK